MFDEHKEIYLFSQTSVRIQLHDTKGVKSQSENRKLDEETLVSRKVYLFHTDFSPCSNLRYQGRRELCIDRYKVSSSDLIDTTEFKLCLILYYTFSEWHL